MMAMLSGDVQVMFNNVQTAIEHIRVGRMIALAVNEPERLPGLPDLPAVAETIPGFEMSGWQGIVAPAKTPKEIIARLSREIKEIMNDPDVVRGLRDQHVIPFTLDGDAAIRLQIKEIDKSERIVKNAKIRGP